MSAISLCDLLDEVWRLSYVVFRDAAVVLTDRGRGIASANFISEVAIAR
jgi:hypothetical protein